MDPDVPIPSVEADNNTQSQHAQPLKVNTSTVTTFAKDSTRSASSPSRTPFKTPRSHPSSPASKSRSRSPSATSSHRNDKRPPGLERKISSPSIPGGRAGSSGHQPQYRRASSTLNPSTPTKMKISAAESLLSRKPLTSEVVAQEYFRKELEYNNGKQNKVAVIVHDSCYGHRYSRPRTSKANLSLIVERPERILATILGVTTAYVRLGDRHKDGQYSPHPQRDISNMGMPPFDLRKTTRSLQLNHPAVVSVHGSKWMEELQIMCDSAEAKLSMNQKETARPIGYGKDEKGNSLPALHSGDLYLSQESLAALQGCLGGVCDAVDTVFQSETTRRVFVGIRPPGHHCSANVPSGFCWLNNVHVGITYGAMNHGLTHAAIIDFDLHHGDGSQTITWNHNEDAQSLPKNASPHKKTPIGYYSLHDINSFPCEWGDKEKVQNASLCVHNAHGQSIWNVHLEPWKSLEEFWRLYESKYNTLLAKARDFLKKHSEHLRSIGVHPKAAIFLSAGFDASQWEGEGMQRHKVNVPTEFYARFTADVVDLAAEPDLGVDGRIVSVLEGGYSDRALTSGVLSHLCGMTHSLETGSRMALFGGLGIPEVQNEMPNTVPYHPMWWDVENLELLEAIVAGRPPPPTKTKDKGLGSYSSPTQASTAKMTEVARERRSLSAQLEARLFLDSAPPEPAPEVDWVTAAHELSRLIIPQDRQTKSCTHEELNAEAARARKERQSVLMPTAQGGTDEGRQLRDRKAKPAPLNAVLAVRRSSRDASRRTTIGGVSDLPDPSMRERSTERPRRRSSAASDVLSSFQEMKLEDKSETRSSRPSSRQGSTGTADSLGSAAKKPKAAAKKQSSSRTNSPRKPKVQAPAIQRVPSQRSKPKPKTTATDAQVSQPTQQDTSSEAKNDEMSDLTSGMKKISIKLNMPAGEQQSVNQRTTQQEKPQRPKVVRKPSAPKGPKTKPVSTNGAVGTPIIPEATVLSKAEALPSFDTAGALAPGQQQHITSSTIPSRTENAADLTRPVDAGVAGSETSAVDPAQPPLLQSVAAPTHSSVSERQMSNSHAHESSNGAPVPLETDAQHSASIDHMQIDQVNELPPASSTSFLSPKQRRELPTFTSTSPIPFGKQSGPPQVAQENKENHETKSQQQLSIWDIPETPQK